MIINIYKPVGWTSFDVVKKIRGITNEKKVGHAGTLDPFAEGVLILGTGKDTKQLTSISSTYKSYIATLKLGEETDSMDVDGKIISTKKVSNMDKLMIVDILDNFVGEQLQIPPMYSAKKINGKRLYTLARQNIEIKRDPVEIDIKKIELLEYSHDTIIFNVICSKGTYIRVLGSDIAKALGTVGHLTKLIRSSVGDYYVSESVEIEEFEKQWKNTTV